MTNVETKCRRPFSVADVRKSVTPKAPAWPKRFCPTAAAPVDTFHYLSQCPHEATRPRDDEKARNEGKFCTWCKETGDGRHTFDECHEAIEFRRDLRRIQRNAYDALEFC
ncbi:hypothetical protein DPSP01_013640 [Paraphaeosphaeria sporulosa]